MLQRSNCEATIDVVQNILLAIRLINTKTEGETDIEVVESLREWTSHNFESIGKEKTSVFGSIVETITDPLETEGGLKS
jgi:hypothetical protein